MGPGRPGSDVSVCECPTRATRDALLRLNSLSSYKVDEYHDELHLQAKQVAAHSDGGDVYFVHRFLKLPLLANQCIHLQKYLQKSAIKTVSQCMN